mmetsp:Transcript_17518/g.46242  ORF Transcript_17518/g.46242 Transcript_17518/m.46242 type:complete len:216 (-) Transcript_17518:377-1024(-)
MVADVDRTGIGLVELIGSPSDEVNAFPSPPTWMRTASASCIGGTSGGALGSRSLERDSWMGSPSDETSSWERGTPRAACSSSASSRATRERRPSSSASRASTSPPPAVLEPAPAGRLSADGRPPLGAGWRGSNSVSGYERSSHESGRGTPAPPSGICLSPTKPRRCWLRSGVVCPGTSCSPGTSDWLTTRVDLLISSSEVASIGLTVNLVASLVL